VNGVRLLRQQNFKVERYVLPDHPFVGASLRLLPLEVDGRVIYPSFVGDGQDTAIDPFQLEVIHQGKFGFELFFDFLDI
jgi:hypothetical protein